MTDQEYREMAMMICMDNQDAFDCLIKLKDLCRIWDDCWDCDKMVDRDDVDNVFSDIAFELSRNEFYRKNRDALEAQIFVSWNAWQAANEWKEHPERAKRLYAWFIRDYCFEIEHLVAWLVGGKEHAKKLNLIIRDKALNQLLAQEDREELGYGIQ